MLLAAASSAAGAWLRSSGSSQAATSAGYLLGTLTVFLAIGSALLHARAAGMLVVFMPDAIRRRALLSLLAGVVAALLGCASASAAPHGTHHALVSAAAEGVLAAGVTLGLSGLCTLLWAFGLGYAGTRIERLSEEDW
jgi:hypothetical protein